MFEIRAHERYNPAALTPLNIVPGLLGTILTLTMLIFTSLSVTRETERGTMESLLAMPITPFEIMLGKIAPYVLVGFVQAALILGAGVLMFGVPIVGNLALLAALTTLFIATNLSFGYTFSTLAQNQLQAIQMSMMFFLPNMMLSGFIFPFLGMPRWAQVVGEWLPLTHYMRIVRAIMLKGATLFQLQYDTLALAGSDGLCHGDCRHAFPPYARLIGRTFAWRASCRRRERLLRKDFCGGRSADTRRDILSSRICLVWTALSTSVQVQTSIRHRGL